MNKRCFRQNNLNTMCLRLFLLHAQRMKFLLLSTISVYLLFFTICWGGGLNNLFFSTIDNCTRSVQTYIYVLYQIFNFINLLKVKYDKRFKGEKHNNVEKNNIKLTEYNGGLELTCDYWLWILEKAFQFLWIIASH